MEGVKDVIRPECRPHNDEGNIYSLIGEVTLVLENKGLMDKANEFVRRAMDLPSYDEVLTMSQDYIQFHHGESNEPETHG